LPEHGTSKGHATLEETTGGKFNNFTIMSDGNSTTAAAAAASDAAGNTSSDVTGILKEIGSAILLFCLVFGMSATVEMKKLKKQLRNRQALLIGLLLQFIILPFCGFVVVKILHMHPVMGITLLVVTSSPGGSYSNWWCSLFNAELSLSITMTAISTLLSTIMLPANLVLYTHWTYSSDVVKSLNWYALFVGIVVVIGGITCGLVSSQYTKLKREDADVALFHKRANLLGNIAGILLITLSVTVSSTGPDTALWDQDASFYIGVALPFLLGLTVAVLLTSKLDLVKPERVAIAVKSSFQNTGIATSVAMTMFANDETKLAHAVAVPLYYGMVEAIGLAIFCIVCWKLGWTKAPTDENLCVVLYNSYEVEEQVNRETAEVAIEVVLGDVGGNGNNAADDAVGKDKNTACAPNDLIFEQTNDGAYVVDDESLNKVRERHEAKKKSNSNNHDDCNRSGGDNSMDEGEDSPTLSSSTASADDDDVHHLQPQPQHCDSEQPSSSSSSPTSGDGGSFGGRGFTRTVAARMKARVTGYRQTEAAAIPPSAVDDGQQHSSSPYMQDTRIHGALDNETAEDSTVSRRRVAATTATRDTAMTSPAPSTSVFESCDEGVKPKRSNKRYEAIPAPSEQKEEITPPDRDGGLKMSSKRYNALPFSAESLTPSPEKAVCSSEISSSLTVKTTATTPATGKQID